MNRRHFIATAGGLLLGASFSPRLGGGETRTGGGPGISWHRHRASGLFDRVTLRGRPWLDPEARQGVFDGFVQLFPAGRTGPEATFGCERARGQFGPIHASLTHKLRRAGSDATENLLEGTLTLRNTSDRPQEAVAGFLTGIGPGSDAGEQQVYAPFSAAGLRDADDDPRRRLKDCRQTVGADGFLAHYLEPQASDPRHTATRAPLLAPVVDLFTDTATGRAALFGLSTEPVFFEARQGRASRAWRMGRRLELAPGQSRVLRAFLLFHPGDATEAWKAFHRFGHREDFPALGWPREVRVHYYDFLSAATPDRHRGEGYDVDLPHFKEFRVGMATQHGYYLSYGDFVHPDRKTWTAMPTDAAGPVPMSLQKIKARVGATRRAGVRPAIYMHYTILDEGSPLFERMRDSVLVDAAGKPVRFGWEGPDVIKTTWKMSHASPEWRQHLVRQAQWIMELFDPDAIVLDETFTALGWDHHPSHGGPLSQGGIQLMRQLRAAVRAFGPEKALFASDCSMGGFCLWGDGEAGDHCYDRLLGQELYRRPPIRYLAALGSKAWLPCAWLCKSLWPVQVDLARKAGAAVSVTNGWGDNLGLTHLPAETQAQMLRDIGSLARG